MDFIGFRKSFDVSLLYVCEDPSKDHLKYLPACHTVLNRRWRVRRRFSHRQLMKAVGADPSMVVKSGECLGFAQIKGSPDDR
jgi:hypothetical protein